MAYQDLVRDYIHHH